MFLQETPPSKSSLTIRNLDTLIKERLRVQAARHGHSMEAEARQILQTALAGRATPAKLPLAHRIHQRFAALGGVDLDIPPRETGREPPLFK